MRALLIDDDPVFRQLLAEMIASCCPEVIVEHYDPLVKGRPGADFALAEFDLVLLDYRLGQDDGLDWLQDFKGRPDCPPTIILTGAGDETVAVRAMKLGADNYLSKQRLSKEALAQAIQEVMPGSVPQAGSTLQMDAPAAVLPKAELHLTGYRMIKEIGEGAGSRVFLVVPEGGGEPVVAKILLEELVKDHEFLARFLNEYKIAAKIESDYVGKIFNYGFSDTSIYILMEYLSGGDMQRYFTEQRVSQGQILAIFRQVLMALRDIHAAGVLHRDLKPHNVMFRADGSVALVDFGIAKLIDEPGITRQGTLLGSPTYMSPEMILGRPVDARADLYSAGIMLFKMLTNTLPFQGESAQEIADKHINAPVPPLPRSQDEFQPLIDKLLGKQPDERLASANAALQFIDKIFYGQE
ncbi:MAG: protein kinase [Burkholderiales bacterium]|nr:protein kinase [Burkholderiales bacterium]